jgi:hypothetical protein
MYVQCTMRAHYSAFSLLVEKNLYLKHDFSLHEIQRWREKGCSEMLLAHPTAEQRAECTVLIHVLARQETETTRS